MSHIEPIVITPSGGDGGNPHYTAELSDVKRDEVISQSASSVTGDRGNVHYSRELDQTPAAAGNVCSARRC